MEKATLYLLRCMSAFFPLTIAGKRSLLTEIPGYSSQQGYGQGAPISEIVECSQSTDADQLCSAWKKPNNQTILRKSATPAFLRNMDFTDVSIYGTCSDFVNCSLTVGALDPLPGRQARQCDCDRIRRKNSR